jgi:hypothetical protein
MRTVTTKMSDADSGQPSPRRIYANQKTLNYATGPGECRLRGSNEIKEDRSRLAGDPRWKALMRSEYESVRPGRVAGARIAVLKSVKDVT